MLRFHAPVKPNPTSNGFSDGDQMTVSVHKADAPGWFPESEPEPYLWIGVGFKCAEASNSPRKDRNTLCVFSCREDVRLCAASYGWTLTSIERLTLAQAKDYAKELGRRYVALGYWNGVEFESIKTWIVSHAAPRDDLRMYGGGK